MSAHQEQGACLMQLRNIARTYKLGASVINALLDVNLKVQKGEQLAIVGPSGSGKSTLMNLMGLLERPSSGEIHLNGMNVGDLTRDDLAAIRSQAIGFVFQQFHLIPYLTAAQNVELPLRYQQLSASERAQRVTHSLSCVGLAQRMGHRPNQLSGGERQRVAIARALVCHPQIILADEPTGALDSVNGQAVLDLMLGLSASLGVTLLVITHDIGLAERFPRCIRLLDGRVVSENLRHQTAVKEI